MSLSRRQQFNGRPGQIYTIPQHREAGMGIGTRFDISQRTRRGRIAVFSDWCGGDGEPPRCRNTGGPCRQLPYSQLSESCHAGDQFAPLRDRPLSGRFDRPEWQIAGVLPTPRSWLSALNEEQNRRYLLTGAYFPENPKWIECLAKGRVIPNRRRQYERIR